MIKGIWYLRVNRLRGENEVHAVITTASVNSDNPKADQGTCREHCDKVILQQKLRVCGRKTIPYAGK